MKLTVLRMFARPPILTAVFAAGALAGCATDSGDDPLSPTADTGVDTGSDGGTPDGGGAGDGGSDAGSDAGGGSGADAGDAESDGQGGHDASDVGQDDCVSDEAFFEREVQQKVILPVCAGCHTAQGLAGTSELVFVPAVQPDYLDRNREALAHVARLQYDGVPLVLMKPTGRIEHGGGAVVPEGSEQLAILEEFVARLDAPVDCGSADDLVTDGLVLLDPVQSLRKASMALRGNLPSPEEYASVLAGGEAALRPAIEGMLDDEAFFGRLREVYNDTLFTDKYLSFRGALSLLNSDQFPSRYFHEGAATQTLNDTYRVQSNLAVGREPLELIVHVVRQGRPFTEILTADYVLVNDFSAVAYGLLTDRLPDVDDPDAYVLREARIPGIPHAGVLSTPTFLARYPSTATNRNRHRARIVFDRFMATDILALADRPIDPNSSEYHNPTRDDPKCNVCHAILDPVAGTFQNFDDTGHFEVPEDGWYAEMLAPGFGRELLPSEQRTDALGWLAAQIAADDRFAIATVQTIWRGFAGLPILAALPASEEEADVEGRQEAYQAQRARLSAIAAELVQSEYDFRVAVVEVMLSPEFRAAGATVEAEAWELVAAGNARLLSPEQLDRRVEAVTGYPWRGRTDRTTYLMDRYRILYGGIDSDGITKRLAAMNGMMANIAERMAFDVSCRTVSRDLSLDMGDRRLLPMVQSTFVPLTPEGFEVPEAETAIRQNIQYLHAHVLGESLAIDDPEIDATYELWYALWQQNRAAIAAGTLSGDLPGTCQSTVNFFTGESLPTGRRVTADRDGTIRAWMGVMAYLLGDSRFLHE